MIDAIDFLQKHWAIVAAIAGCVWTYFWLTMDTKYAKKTDFSKLQDAIKQNDKRVTTLEAKQEDAPTPKDFAHLEILLVRLEGEINTTNEVLKSTSEQLKLLLQNKMHKD